MGISTTTTRNTELVPAEIAVFRQAAQVTLFAVKANLEGVTQEQSLVQPQPAGNCINWVLGHITWVYNNVLQMVHEEQVVESSRLKRYDRGTAPLHGGAEAVEVKELLLILEQAVQRLDRGLSKLTEEELAARAPVSPTNDPNETVRSLLGIVAFHQAYHTGQLGILRRVIGLKGAIA